MMKSQKTGPEYIIAPKTQKANLKCQQTKHFISVVKLIKEKGFTMIIRLITTF